MSRVSLRALVIIGVSLLSLTGHAKAVSRSTPIGLGIVPPAQFPSSKFTVTGLRLSAGMGINRGMTGIDLGLIGNKTEQDFKGIAVAGIFNWNKGFATVYGAQIAGITNVNESEGQVYGLQAALIANLSDYTDIYGVQLGLYNRARHVYGLQIGLINVAQNLHGIQIGLANFNDGGPFGVSPLINFGW